MRVKYILDEDFVNYKKPSMLIGTITCNFKCFTERNLPIEKCINYHLVNQKIIDIPDEEILNRYLTNIYTEAIIFGGMEPFLQFDELVNLIKTFREKTDDDIIIYTGYYKEEIEDKLKILCKYKNIIIKYGRYIEGNEEHFDKVLGINLVSDNQYAEYLDEENI